MGWHERLRKAKEIFIESDEEEGKAPDTAATEVERLLADLEGRTPGGGGPHGKPGPEGSPAAAQGPGEGPAGQGATAGPVLATPGGPVAFPAIYQQAEVPAVAFTAEQMLDMLASYPAELPMATKRQMVAVTFKAMGKAIGATPQTIAADASQKRAALAGHVEAQTQHVAEMVATAEREIAGLQAQIEEKRRSVEGAQNLLEQLRRSCEEEAQRLNQVLDFFGPTPG